MINPHKIGKAIKNFTKWLFITNYGRFILGGILTLFGIFSEYSTIDFLIIGWPIFDYLLYAGVLLLIGQFLLVIVMGVYFWITHKL